MRALLTGAALLAALPAHADWQYTRWGMSPDQVVAAAGAGTTRGNWDERSNEFGRALVSGVYVSQGLRFRTDFLFSRQTNELAAVYLDYAEHKNCGYVRAALFKAYGSAVEDRKTDVGLSTTEWRDHVNRNEVVLNSLSKGDLGFCSIIYRPLLSAGAKGGL